MEGEGAWKEGGGRGEVGVEGEKEGTRGGATGSKGSPIMITCA